jgi:NAD-dependent dihydropyrimidine dehydrogenase PreA subunit
VIAQVSEDCIACGICLPECPTESISEGDGTICVIMFHIYERFV